MLLFENCAVTVTVVPDALSDTLDGFADRLIAGAPSLSVIVTPASFTVSPLEVPSTLMLSLPSTSVSSTGVSVNVPVALLLPAAMVTSKPVTAA